MIHHKITNVHTANASQRSMPEGRYFGFAVGPDSHHTELLVTLENKTYFVSLGSPTVLPLGGIEGVPEVAPVRYAALQLLDNEATPHALNAWQSKVHVLGHECCAELEIPVATKLRTIVEKCNWSDGDGGSTDFPVCYVPFAGRSRAMFSISGDAGQVTVHGANYYNPVLVFDTSDPLTVITEADTEYPVIATVAHTTGLTDYIVEDLDPYDVLILRIGDGSNFAPIFALRVC